jgi:hypothetical protein
LRKAPHHLIGQGAFAVAHRGGQQHQRMMKDGLVDKFGGFRPGYERRLLKHGFSARGVDQGPSGGRDFPGGAFRRPEEILRIKFNILSKPDFVNTFPGNSALLLRLFWDFPEMLRFFHDRPENDI